MTRKVSHKNPLYESGALITVFEMVDQILAAWIPENERLFAGYDDYDHPIEPSPILTVAELRIHLTRLEAQMKSEGENNEATDALAEQIARIQGQLGYADRVRAQIESEIEDKAQGANDCLLSPVVIEEDIYAHAHVTRSSAIRWAKEKLNLQLDSMDAPNRPSAQTKRHSTRLLEILDAVRSAIFENPTRNYSTHKPSKEEFVAWLKENHPEEFIEELLSRKTIESMYKILNAKPECNKPKNSNTIR